jgi:hypothetical protein
MSLSGTALSSASACHLNTSQTHTLNEPTDSPPNVLLVKAPGNLIHVLGPLPTSNHLLTSRSHQRPR